MTMLDMIKQLEKFTQEYKKETSLILVFSYLLEQLTHDTIFL